MGHDVTENTLDPSFEFVYTLDKEGKSEQYTNVVKWIKSADVMIAEASWQSLGIGYEISLALENKTPVIVLYNHGKAPHFLEGRQGEELAILDYDVDNLAETLEEGLEIAKSQADTRFNFFISPRHTAYLDYISKNQRIPRSVYLRRLIKQHRDENDEYLQ